MSDEERPLSVAERRALLNAKLNVGGSTPPRTSPAPPRRTPDPRKETPEPPKRSPETLRRSAPDPPQRNSPETIVDSSFSVKSGKPSFRDSKSSSISL